VIGAPKNRGFTLLEILAALFILSITVVFVVLIVGTIKIVRDSSYENRAFHIAENELDTLRAAGYGALPVSGTPFSNPELANLPQGSASTTVTVWNAKTKQVEAGVSWRDSSGVTRVASLTTLIVETGGL